MDENSWKKLLNNRHYWAVFEFAAGRVQIHTHMLAITEDQVKILTDYFNLQNETKHVSLMATYARNILELTEDHPGYISEAEYTNQQLQKQEYTQSLRQRYIETDNDNNDQKMLCHCCQIHNCNEYCMVRKKSKQYNVEWVQEILDL